MLHLVSKSGLYQGLSWPIVEQPLVMGRDANCDIQLNEPVVSRHHCWIYLQPDGPYIRDLDSRNSTLVNGTPVKEAKLNPGDEVAVGASVFLVTQMHGNACEKPEATLKAGDTSSLKIDAPIYSRESGDSLFKRGTPRTTRELVHLFSLGRELSQASSRTGLFTMLLHVLAEQFKADHIWVALGDASVEEPEIIPHTDRDTLVKNETLFERVRQAVRDKRSLLLPQQHNEESTQNIRTAIVAPIVLGAEVLGTLVAQAHNRVYEGSDLEYLIAHAYAIAPYLRVVERLEHLELENRRLVAGIAHAGPIVGSSPALNALRDQARDAARSSLSALILGETGTGKELVARLIHELSALADKPMVVVNCAAIPDELFESEVFGHEKGAFTGAFASKRGLLEECDGGTLFLDEVGDLSLANQARLLRAIETGSFRRLGGRADIHVSVRIIAATNKQLEKEVEERRFRRDLFHRLNIFTLTISPLRDRRGDIPELVEHFRSLAVKRDGRGPSRFTPEALRALERHPWPGNVRELRNVVERAMVVAKTDNVTPSDLGLESAPVAEDHFPTLEQRERDHIAEALRRAEGNVKVAAEMLGLGRSTLYRKLTEYGMTS